MITTTMYKDILEFTSMFTDIEWLQNKSIVVTGATGFIGSSLVRYLLALNNRYNINLSLIGLVRNLSKAKLLFPKTDILWIEHNFEQDDVPEVPCKVDYIIHTASPTASLFMMNHPIETAKTIINGTLSILKLAQLKNSYNTVFLSSLEVYGQSLHEELIKESFSGSVDPLSPRSCYPLAKRMAENLCVGYSSEYSIPVVIGRLTQTIGAGVSINDQRVFMDFARKIAYGQDLIIKTEGYSSKPYIYISDAITAILILLKSGNKGTAYNIANSNSYISIRDLAYLMTKGTTSKVKFIIDEQQMYPPETHLNLDTSKLECLNWFPKIPIEEMINRQISYFLDLKAQNVTYK